MKNKAKNQKILLMISSFLFSASVFFILLSTIIIPHMTRATTYSQTPATPPVNSEQINTNLDAALQNVRSGNKPASSSKSTTPTPCQAN